jgi:LPXTG-motif cell wall-anchored protein
MPVETAIGIDDLKTVEVAAVQPTGEEVPVTTVVENPPLAASDTAAPVETAETLPKTASSLPLFAMIGLLSLCAGFALLIVTKRSA